MQERQASPAKGAAGGRRGAGDLFLAGRDHLVEFLIGYSLLESYFAFVRHRRGYPFIAKEAVVPGAMLPKGEHRYQNTAFVILLDQAMPESLIKHFRLRNSNRITPLNLRRLSPDAAVPSIEPDELDLCSAGSDALLRRVVPLDYAVVAQRPDPKGPPLLSHAHVKIERLMDNALRELALELGYVERRLFERGEDYVDALEGKYYEYYGFPSNSSGRKSAAAMAAQLLAGTGMRFAVALANQDDCRVTLLSESERVTQYLLIRLDRGESARLIRTARAAGAANAEPYIMTRDGRNAPIVVYRVDFVRSAAARGGERTDAERLLRQPWLEIADEWIMRLPPSAEDGAGAGLDLPDLLPFPWAHLPTR